MEKKKLIDFLNSYALMKTLPDGEESFSIEHKNVIEMDIFKLKGNTGFGFLDMEICHYLKNESEDDGMTVRFIFDNGTNSEVKSKVRQAIFRKDVREYKDKLQADNTLVTLQIDTVDDFIEFFQREIINKDLKSV